MPESLLRALHSRQITQPQQATSRAKERLSLLKSPAVVPDDDEVRLGLHRHEFRAWLQPKFDLRSGQVVGAEVLARWQHPSRGILGPASFIDLMTRKGWLDDLLLEMLEQSLAFQLKLHQQGRSLDLAFNLSPEQLNGDTLIDRLQSRLGQQPMVPATLTLEITEDGAASVSEACIEQLERLSRMGIKLSLDDFGVGHSSLLRLCQIPFSEVKLAAAFTALLERPGRHQAVIRHTLALVDDLGLQLIVEGIETHAQRMRLIEMGARTGQGFLYAKPMPISAFEQWMNTPRMDFQPASTC